MLRLVTQSLSVSSLVIGAVFLCPSAMADKPAAITSARSAPPARERTDAEKKKAHFEAPDARTNPAAPRAMRTGPAGRSERDGYVAVQVNVNAQGQNIIGDAGNEPSIAVDPTNPNRMAIGWRQFDTITNNFRQAGYGYTTDGGATWTFPGVIEPGVFRSDPVLASDANGVFYYNSLTASGNDFWCNVFKSTDGGATWDTGTYAYGGDKQWMSIDTTGGLGDGNIYAHWTIYYSACNYDSSISKNENASWYDCMDVPDNPYWGTTTVDVNGDVYISGTGFQVAKSTSMKHPLSVPGWDWSRNVDLGGSSQVSTGPNPGGLLGQTWIASDHSDGPTRGNLYLLSSVDPSGGDPLDVRFARSSDGGWSWSSSVRVNDDPVGNGAWQWFGTMSVAPDGRIDVVWLDTRNNPGTYLSELYYSYSTDAGVTWSEDVALTTAFDPHLGWPQQNKMGDYFHMESNETGAHLAFAATFNGEQDVYYMHIPPPTECPWDVAPAGGDNTVGLGDLNALLSNWGPCPAPCAWDFAPVGGDNMVGLGDLNALLSNWGPCP